MRILYLLLKISVGYSLSLYFKRIRKVNAPKEFFGRTIYVSNHPASFMDPILIGAMQRPIIFFMTRSDVFTKFSRPFLWACHMLPIYRQHDGEDTKKKNDEVFEKCTRILSFGRNLLLFGEGFTDDTFIRRLKPVKKGAVRIGFATLEKMNWKKPVYMAALGCNYTEPNTVRSEVLLSYSNKICLNDYKELYEQAPNKAITEVTNLIEKMMQEQITHVKEVKNADFHEQIMTLNRKGINAKNHDDSIPLKARWNYSKSLAKWLNNSISEENTELIKLQGDTDKYFKLLKRFKLDEQLLFWKSSNGSRVKELIWMILLFPFMIIGSFHLFIPYKITTNFVEKSFKRKVFWGSTKVLVGGILSAIYNGVFIWLFHAFIYPSWSLALVYYFSIPVFGILAYNWFTHLRSFIAKGKLAKTDTTSLQKKREDLLKRIEQLIPDSF